MIILSLIPALIDAIVAVEKAIPMSGTGEAKTALIIESITAVNEDTKTLVPIIQRIISVIVKTFNALEIFKK